MGGGEKKNNHQASPSSPRRGNPSYTRTVMAMQLAHPRLAASRGSRFRCRSRDAEARRGRAAGVAQARPRTGPRGRSPQRRPRLDRPIRGANHQPIPPGRSKSPPTRLAGSIPTPARWERGAHRGPPLDALPTVRPLVNTPHPPGPRYFPLPSRRLARRTVSPLASERKGPNRMGAFREKKLPKRACVPNRAGGWCRDERTRSAC